MSILNKEFYTTETTNWNCQLSNYINSSTTNLDKMDKLINEKTSLMISTSLDFKEKSGNNCAFNSSNSSHLKKNDKLSSIPNHTQANNLLANQLNNQLNNQIKKENDNLDFTTLHNDVISLSDHDLDATKQSNCTVVIKNKAPFQFNSSSSSSSLNSSSNQINLNNLNSSSNSSNHQLNKSSSFKNSSSPNHPHELNNNYHHQTIDTQQSNVDDGLTNLSWLQNLNMCMTRLGGPTPPASPLCNLTPTYFSVISPSQSNNQTTIYNNSTFLTLNKPLKQNKTNDSTRKQKAKLNGSKTKFNKNSTQKKQNKNCQNLNESDNQESSSHLTSQAQINHHKVKDERKEEVDFVEMNNSLDLLYNGDHQILDSDSFCPSLCNDDLSKLNSSSLLLDATIELTKSDSSKNQLNRDYLDQTDQILNEQIDYKSNGSIKPPFSYATLICMAMKSNRNKMTLRSIYKWIRENFLYYRNADPSWQVCVIKTSFILCAQKEAKCFLMKY